MSLFPETIQIAGKRHKVASLVEGQGGVLPQEVLAFLGQWYNDKDHIVVHTSGSTGTPKEILLDKGFVAASAHRTLDFFQLQPGDKALLCLPIKYIAGKLMVVRALLGGLDLHCQNPSNDFSFLAKSEANFFHFAAMVPNQAQKLLHIPGSFSQIKNLLIGGSALPQPLETALAGASSSCYIGYGMTETATHIALRKIDGMAGWYCALDGISLSLLTDGRLIIAMPGLKEPLITNDLAEIAENGREFRILGRADNVIISGGVKYIPEELEKRLDNAISYPFFISSLPDDILGNKIVLAVEAKKSCALLTELTAIIKEKFSRYERPKEIIFKENFLRTATGKIRRIL